MKTLANRIHRDSTDWAVKTEKKTRVHARASPNKPTFRKVVLTDTLTQPNI